MCNPRRIKVRASRSLTEAWQAEITRTARLTETLSGEARIVEPLGARLPAPVRDRLIELLEADPMWRAVEDGYRYDVPGGHLTYYPDTGDLEVVANATAELTAEGIAARTRGGIAEGTAESEAEVSFYSDGYAGRNKAAAEREGETKAGRHAEEEARKNLATQLEADRQAAEEALAAQATAVEQEALDDARRRIEEQRDTQQEELTAEAGRQVRRLQENYLRVINLPLTHAYRDVILERANQPDVRNLYHTEQDGIIEIQFEMES